MCIFYARKGKSMKHNKILGLVGIAAALTLVACGGDKKSTAPGKTSGKVTSKAPVSRAPVSREPQKGVTFDTVTLETKTDNKVYAKVAGTETLYKAGELKWAWGLADRNGTFVYGKETPEAADFAAAVTFEPAADATAKPFSVELCLTDIANITTEVYTIWGGADATSYAALTIGTTDFQANDGNYTYFIRDDQSAAGLAIEVIDKTFVIYNVDVVKNPNADHQGFFAKLGGEQATTYTLEQVNAWNTKCDFQCMSPYSKPAAEFFWEVDGKNVYCYMDMTSIVDPATATMGRNYMTHFEANKTDSGDPGKCLPAESIADRVVEFASDNVKVTIHFDKTKGQNDGPSEYYGALGFVIDYINAPEGGEGGEQA